MKRYKGHFHDKATLDPESRTAVSIRDGTLEYTGSELGMAPPDKLFRVYRNPATVANAAMNMLGIPLTDGHVELQGDAPTDGGAVETAEMIVAKDAAQGATLAVRNKLTVSDTLAAVVQSGTRELSLGYTAELIPHDDFDFEQIDIQPHHLAVVDSGRCGESCRFLDEIHDEEPMKLHAAFLDAEGALSLQQIAELAVALPEAIKAVPIDQLQEVLPALMALVEAAKGVIPAAEPELPAADPEEIQQEDEGMPDKIEQEDEGMPDKIKQQAADAATAIAVKQHGETISKAREFLPADYAFGDHTGPEIMRAALATESSAQFADEELAVAFKLLKRTESKYAGFGDAAADTLDSLKDQEI